MSTILFTGGHHNSALVVAQRLRSMGHKIIWVGHKFTARGEKQLSAEFQEVTAAGIPFFELKTGKFYKIKNPFEYLKIGLGFFQSLSYLLKTKPDLIFSFGGYLSVPIVIVGSFLGIPAVSHEQTVTAGWANKAVAPFVKRIFLTHASSQKNYPPKKTTVVGLPLRAQILEKKKYRQPKPPLIFVTCGKQGSHIINQAVFSLVPQLISKYQLVHQTGASTLTRDVDKARRLKQSLPPHLRSRYRHQPYFYPAQASKYLKTAKLVVSRAGAHTTYELLFLKKRALLIPIPWVSHNEQMQNAKLLQRSLGSTILEEKDLTPASLHRAITATLGKPIRRPKTTIITDSTDRIINALAPYLHVSTSSSSPSDKAS